jgi:Tfp pilus assembly protein PilO
MTSLFEKPNGFVLALLVAGVAWWACSLSIKPYDERENEDRVAIAGLKAQINQAATTAQEIEKWQRNASETRSQIDRLEENLPSRVMLPEKVTQHFASFGLEVSAVRLKAFQEEPGLHASTRGYWSVSMPLLKSDHKEAGVIRAVMEFERHHPFIKVVEFALQPTPDDSARQLVTLELMALVRN